MEIKDCNVMIDCHNFFNQVVSNIEANKNISEINSCSDGNNNTTGCSLHHTCLKVNDKLIVVDLNKQPGLSSYPKTMLKINFIGTLDNDWETAIIFFITEEVKQTILDSLHGIMKVL